MRSPSSTSDARRARPSLRKHSRTGVAAPQAARTRLSPGATYYPSENPTATSPGNENPTTLSDPSLLVVTNRQYPDNMTEIRCSTSPSCKRYSPRLYTTRVPSALISSTRGDKSTNSLNELENSAIIIHFKCLFKTTSRFNTKLANFAFLTTLIFSI